MRAPLRAAAALVALGVLPGCAAPAASPARGSGAPVTAAANPNTPQLVAQRQAAGLPDCEPPAAASEPVTYGLPDVVLPCLGSERSVNLAHLRGRPLVINVWAEWCGPCRDEAPHLAEFAGRAAGKVDVLGVDFDDPNPGKAIEFAKAAGWAYPHLSDSAGVLRSRMAIPGIPVTLVVAPDGRVVYRKTGVLASTAELTGIVAAHTGVTV